MCNLRSETHEEREKKRSKLRKGLLSTENKLMITRGVGVGRWVKQVRSPR